MIYFRLKGTMILCAAVVVFCFTRCKKEQIAATAADAPNNSKELSAANPLSISSAVGDSLVVSTILKIKNADPQRICTSENGTVYVSTILQTVFKIPPKGTGSVFLREIGRPFGLKAAANGDIYVADFGNNNIIRGEASGKKDTVHNSIGKHEPVYAPTDLAVAPDNTLYIANSGASNVTKVTPLGVFSVLAGGNKGANGYIDGMGSNARIGTPTSIKLSKDNNLYLVDDSLGFGDVVVGGGLAGRVIRRITLKGDVKTIFRAGGNRKIMDIAVAKRDQNFKPTNTESLFVLFDDSSISYVTTSGVETPFIPHTPLGFIDGKVRDARFRHLTGISIHENSIYLVDSENLAIRKITKM